MERNVVERPLGDWLVEWGVISEKQLAVAVNDSRAHLLPVGLCLLLREQVDADILQSAVVGQAYLRDGAVGLDDACKAMNLVSRKHISLGVAFNLLSVQPQALPRNRLGDLLAAAGAVSSHDLKIFLSLARATGLPLGRVMTNAGCINEDLLNYALNLQTRIRSGEIDRNSAIEVLTHYVKEQAKDSVVSGTGLHAETLLGSLLVKAGVLSESTVRDALNYSIREDVRLGEILVARGVLSQAMIDSVVEVQKLIRCHKFTIPQGLSVLRNVSSAQRRESMRAESSIHGQPRNKPLVMSFYRYLKLTRALPDVILRNSSAAEGLPDSKKSESFQNEMEMTWQELRAVSPLDKPVTHTLPADAKALLQRCGFITDEQLVVAQRAAYTYKLVLDQVMSIEQALIEFHRLKMEEAQPRDWTGTFPNLSAM